MEKNNSFYDINNLYEKRRQKIEKNWNELEKNVNDDIQNINGLKQKTDDFMTTVGKARHENDSEIIQNNEALYNSVIDFNKVDAKELARQTVYNSQNKINEEKKLLMKELRKTERLYHQNPNGTLESAINIANRALNDEYDIPYATKLLIDAQARYEKNVVKRKISRKRIVTITCSVLVAGALLTAGNYIHASDEAYSDVYGGATARALNDTKYKYMSPDEQKDENKDYTIEEIADMEDMLSNNSDVLFNERVKEKNAIINAYNDTFQTNVNVSDVIELQKLKDALEENGIDISSYYDDENIKTI